MIRWGADNVHVQKENPPTIQWVHWENEMSRAMALYQRSPHPRANHTVHEPPKWVVCADFAPEEEDE